MWMSIRANRYPVQDIIRPQHVLVSVFDKTDLDMLVAGFVAVNPNVVFYSTGGIGKRLQEIVSPLNYVPVEQFTGALEMEGGLVKTLHPKVHAGLLGERGNPEHEWYLREVMRNPTGIPGVFFDALICNLYPFEKIVANGASPEVARGNIDIGGPTMIMAAAKNFHSVAAVTGPEQYGGFVENLVPKGGTRLRDRYELAQHAMRRVANYRDAIARHFRDTPFELVERELDVQV